MSVKVINVLQCTSDAEETFEQELKRLVDFSVNEAGCLSYEIYQPKDHKGEYIMIEEWQTEDDFNHHQCSPQYVHFKRISPVMQYKPAEMYQLIRLV